MCLIRDLQPCGGFRPGLKYQPAWYPGAWVGGLPCGLVVERLNWFLCSAAGLSITLVTRVPAPLKSIADQVIRSASSVPANLSEGHGRAVRPPMTGPHIE
ncbi:MAG: hypothetical protein DRJ65_16015 [Acidobacteria bacterium]|nr:MAG: hypothetical protein DRJ65_16015 [Acidobacteriota bacterium]